MHVAQARVRIDEGIQAGIDEVPDVGVKLGGAATAELAVRGVGVPAPDDEEAKACSPAAAARWMEQ